MAVDPNARLRITADDQTRGAWDSALRTANNGSKKISGAFKGALATVSVAAIGNAFKTLIAGQLELAESISNAAVKSGLGVQVIGELGFAASEAGVELAQLSASLGVMQVNIAKAAEGSKGLQDAFGGVGVDFEKFRALRPDQQFEVLAEAISRIEDPAERARAATELFGKSGAQLLPLFEEGAEGIRKAREEAQRLNTVLGPRQVADLKAAGDSVGQLGKAFKGLAGDISAFFAPAIEAASKALTELLAKDDEVDELLEEQAELIGKIRDASQGFSFREFLGITDEDKQRLIAVDDTLRSILFKRGEAFELQMKEEAAKKAALGDQVELPSLGPLLLPGVLKGPDADVRRALDDQRELRDLAMEGEAERNRILDDSQGRGLTPERRGELLEQEREYFAELQQNVLQASEQQTKLSEEVISEYFDRTGERLLERNEFLIGAMEEFGRSVQSSLSDVFFNAGKGADDFADSVLNAFKRILADAAANQVVGLLGGLFGGKTSAGVTSTGGLGGLITSGLGALFGGFRAEGGAVQAGKVYGVGEKGFELFKPAVSGSIIPNKDIQTMPRTGGAISISQTIVMQGGSGGMTRAQMAAFGKEVSDQTVARIKDEKRRGKL